MSVGRTVRDEEIAAQIAELKVDQDTNWRGLFDLPLDTKNTNALLNKFYEHVQSASAAENYKKIHDAIKDVMHNPVKLREKIAEFQLASIFPVMFYMKMHHMYYQATNLLDLMAKPDCPTESMRMLLELIPQKLLPFTNMAINLVRYPEKLDIYLSMLNDHGRRLLLNIRNNNRNTILHAAAPYPMSFQIFLAMAENAELKFNAVLETNDDKVTPLHLAAENSESFFIAFEEIPDAYKYHAAEMQADNGKKLIHFSAISQIMWTILARYPQNEKLAVLTTKPAYGETAIAMACKNYDWLESILNQLAEQDIPKAMSAAGEGGRQLLRKLAHEEPEEMLKVLGLYAEDERFKAIHPGDCIDWKPEYIIRLMNLLSSTNRERPEDIITVVSDKIQFLEGSYAAHASFLLAYAKNNFANAIEVLDAMPTDEDRLKAIHLSGRRGDAFLELAAQRNPEYAETMRDALEQYKDMLEMQSEMERYLNVSDTAEPIQKKSRENTPAPVKRDAQPMFGFFDPTARFGEVPKNIPATMTVAEYKNLQDLHDALQRDALRLGEQTQREYWDYVAGSQHVEVLSKLEHLRKILNRHAGLMKQQGIEPVKVDRTTVMFSPW